MNILQMNNFHYIRGGAEKYYFEVSNLLTNHGHNVSYFSTKHPLNIESPYSKYFGGEMGYTPEFTLSTKVSSALGMLRSPENSYLISKIVDEFDIKIAHAHNIYGRISPSVIPTLKSKGIPTVLTLHDYKLACPIYTFHRDGAICTDCLTHGYHSVVKHRCTKGRYLYSLLHWLEHEFHEYMGYYKKDVSCFICPSKFLLDMHVKAGVPEDKLVHIPNFINEDEYTPNYNNSGYIVFVGRLSSEKGCMTLIEAVKGLDIQLKIVGTGPEANDYIQYVSDNGIPNVVFEGYKSGDELNKIFQDSLFMVIPSEWYENCPMTILEAFAFGKPVVGSQIGGIPEMITPMETGLLFQAGDVADLKEKIKYMLDNPSKVISMGERARLCIEEKYSSHVHYHKLNQIYNEALGSLI